MLLCKHEPEVKNGEPLQLYLIGKWGVPNIDEREVRTVYVCRRCGVVYSTPRTEQHEEQHKLAHLHMQEVSIARRHCRNAWQDRNKEHNIKPSITDAYTDGFYDGVAWAQSQS